MLAAINLDDDSSRNTKKIYNKRSDGVLPSKFKIT